jgi:hypothetical protein
MKILFQKLVSYISPCFNPLDSQICQGEQNIIKSLHISNNSVSAVPSETIPLPSLTSKYLDNCINLPNSLVSNTSPKEINSDFFINITPETYKGMLEGFIKHHGTSSNKCKELILEEGDIADRIYNIHTITGNNINPLLFNKLKKSFSQEFDISSITSTDQINDGAKLVQDLSTIFN